MIGGSRKDCMRNLANERFKDTFFNYLQLLINEQLYAPLGWSCFQKMMFLHGLYTGFFNSITHSWTYHPWTKFDDLKGCLKVRFSHITSGNVINDKLCSAYMLFYNEKHKVLSRLSVLIFWYNF